MTTDRRLEIMANGIMVKIVMEYFDGKCPQEKMGEIAALIQDGLIEADWRATQNLMG